MLLVLMLAVSGYPNSSFLQQYQSLSLAAQCVMHASPQAALGWQLSGPQMHMQTRIHEQAPRKRVQEDVVQSQDPRTDCFEQLGSGALHLWC